MSTELADDQGSSPEDNAEQDLFVLRQDCTELRQVVPAARILIGKSRAIGQRGYSLARVTLEAVLVREDDSRQ